MPINDSEKVDFLWKRTVYGVTKTGTAAQKFASNEIYKSASPITPDQVWKDAASLPLPAPAATGPIVHVHYGAGRIAMTTDPTSTPNETWLATSTHGDITTRLTSFIAPAFDSSYAAQVFIGDPSGGPAARIFPDTAGEEWVFDYNAGVLIFDNAIPANKAATIGTGAVSVAANGIFIQAHRYVGQVGVGVADAADLPLGPMGATLTPAVALTPQSRVTDAIDAINDALGAEIAARQGGDVTDAQNLAIETAARQAAITALESSAGTLLLLGEDEAASAAGAVALTSTTKLADAIFGINEALGVEITARQSGEVTESQNLAIEAAARQAADTAIDAKTAADFALGEAEAYPGAVALTAQTKVADAIFEINEAVADLAAKAGDGFHVVLGSVETEGDGSWAGGAVPLTDATKVSSAIDLINTVLGKLVPPAPPAFPGGVNLTIVNGAGASPKLAAGVTDNSGAAPYAAGAAVTRITAAGPSTNTFATMGPGDQGTVQALVNDVVVGSHTLTGTGDNGSYAGLVLSSQADYPVATPGFWKSINIAAALVAAPIGVSRLKLNDTAAGATAEVAFVRDGLTAGPALSAMSVSEQAAGARTYSSGVPHYGTGGKLLVAASVTNLAGETYYGGTDPLSAVVSAGGSSVQTYSYDTLGVATPIPRQTTAAAVLTPVTLNVDGTNIHTRGLVQLNARNVNGATGATNANAALAILVKAGIAQSNEVDEQSVPVSGLGASPNAANAARVKIAAGGDTPAGAAAAWDSTAALASGDASVVGGVLANDQTNYAIGFLPAGPNYSGRDSAQYVTFAFNRAAASAFKISVTGSYAGCHVKLPGVTDSAAISPNAPNGWLDAFAAYTGAGVPGNSADTTAGCALGTVMSGASGAFQITFGTQSSTNATGNQILIRFKLNLGQSISALSFSN